jgi:hypothetical protein
MDGPVNGYDEERLARERAICEAATAGPWEWRGNTHAFQCWIVSVGTPLRDTVLTFHRWGMGSAQPVFNRDGLLVDGKTLMVRPESHNPWRVTDIDHPDAQFMVHARTGWPEALDQIAVLREALRIVVGTLGQRGPRGEWLGSDWDSEIKYAHDVAHAALNGGAS